MCVVVSAHTLTLRKVGDTTRPFRQDLNQVPYDYSVEVTNRFKGLDLMDRVAIIKSFSDQISRSVVSNSFRPHESQHARPPCPSPTPGVQIGRASGRERV